MANVIHGASHKALKFFRKAPAALAVYWIYASRTNNEGVAWPSLRGLSRDTGWSVNACSKAREWLVKHGALERVTDYKRPNWRKLDAPQRQQKINLDRSEYYRPTGQIVVDGNTYPLLYFGQNEPSDIEDDTPDVSRQRTSAARDVAPDDTELDSSTTKLDSSKTIAANAAPSVSDEKPTATPKPRNPLFDTVATYSFGLRNVDVPKEAAPRIGKIVRFCRDNDVTVDELISFYAWYAKTVGAAHPRDVAKFAEHMTAYRATKASRSHFPPGYIPVAERTNPLQVGRWFEG